MPATMPADVNAPPSACEPDACLARFQHPNIEPISTIRGCVLLALQQHLLARGFKQLMPVLMSPITDPLNHATHTAEITYGKRPLKLTASMIFHKQLAVTAKGHDRIFIIAPNIRLENDELCGSENHLIEFSQCDFEVRNDDMRTAMKRVEGLVRHVVSVVKHRCGKELAALGRDLPHFTADFPVYDAYLLKSEYGPDFERLMSSTESSPFFITNHRREFYDKESAPGSGRFNNFDLVYPEGYGEALSGGEREFEYTRVIQRMSETGVSIEPFSSYLCMAKKGLLLPSAGGGLGIERLMRFICGMRHIRDVTLFDRSVGNAFQF